MTSKQIEAMKLALEALVMYGERHRATYLLGGAWDEEITLGDKAITALEEVLAQPERHELQAKGEHPAPCARHCEANAFQIVIKNLKAQLAQPEQEEKLPPVEIGVDVTDIGTTVVAFYRRPNAVMEMFYSQFHPLAQPEQEPVAWLWELTGEVTTDPDRADGMWLPLYTTPPQHKPLTDEVISALWSWSQSSQAEATANTQQHAFARSIEAAHGIKE